MTKAKELREQSLPELEVTLLETQKKLYALRNNLSTGEEAEGKHKVPQSRRDIARILTVIKEKQRNL